MNFWFLSNFERVAEEKRAVEDLIAAASWLADVVWVIEGADLTLNADLEVDGEQRKIALRYPPVFPASPPSVFPRESDARWSIHQYGASGELCLEWGPDNWHPEVTGAELLKSAYKLLSEESPIGEAHAEVPSRHVTTCGQELRRWPIRWARPAELSEYIQGLPVGAHGVATFDLLYSPESSVLFPRSITVEGSQPWHFAHLPDQRSMGEHVATGVFARTQLTAEEIHAVDLDRIHSLLRDAGPDTTSIPEQEDPNSPLCFALLESKDGSTEMFFVKVNDNRATRLGAFDVSTGDEDRIGLDAGTLASRRVGIVGLGSVGSKIAISLGRSGVRRFLLIDDDLMRPENIVRHALDWRSVGQHKVDAVGDELKRLSPGMEVEVERIRISGQEASARVSRRICDLTECDVIVDATANPKTFNLLGYAAGQSETPMVWGEVFAGGIGGLVARYRPNRDPAPMTARTIISAALETYPPAPGQPVAPYALEGEEEKVLVGTDQDVATIAHHCASVVLDLLMKREPSVFPNSCYLVGLRRAWAFEAPFHTIPIELGGPSESVSESNKAPSPEVLEFLKGIVKRRGSNNSNSD